MPRMLEVSDAVRAEIGDEEADRLLAGEAAPNSYDCTSCRAPGDPAAEQTSTVLFVGEETAVLAFAHAACIPSQVVPVSEDQLQGAVRSIAAEGGGAGEQGVPSPAAAPDAAGLGAAGPDPADGQAVLGVTCGLVVCADEATPALVVEPTGPIIRPGSEGPGDDFLPLLIESGFLPAMDMKKPPAPVTGWSVLLVGGQLHAVMQPGTGGQPPTAWWQAHQPLQVTEGWRAAAAKAQEVVVYATPAGAIGRQPREDLLTGAVAHAAERGLLVGATMPLTGT